MSNTFNNEDYQTPIMPEMAAAEVVANIAEVPAETRAETLERMTSSAIELAASTHPADSSDTDIHRTEVLGGNISAVEAVTPVPEVDLTDPSELRRHGAWIVGARTYELAQNELELAA